MLLSLVGMNHETSPVALRERTTIGGAELPAALRELRKHPAVAACAILDTCNRLELYAVLHERMAGVEALLRFIAERCGESPGALQPHVYVQTRTHAVRHLYRVAAGLESLVLGEDQVLAQVKQAYAAVLEAGSGNAVLHELLLQAIRVGKRVRTETGINAHSISLSTIAVELCAADLGGLAGRNVVVLGAGEMARLAVENLQERGLSRLTVVNRSIEKARSLSARAAARLGASRTAAAGLDALAAVVLEADALISATGAPGRLVDVDTVRPIARARSDKPFVVMDMGVPRDVEPAVGELPHVVLHELDDVKHIASENRRARAVEAERAGGIVDAELPGFLEWLESRYLVPTVSALQQRGEAVLERELQRAMNRLEAPLDARELRVLREMGRRIVKQLVNRPISELKRQAAGGEGRLYAEIACELFDLRLEPDHDGDGVQAAGSEVDVG